MKKNSSIHATFIRKHIHKIHIFIHWSIHWHRADSLVWMGAAALDFLLWTGLLSRRREGGACTEFTHSLTHTLSLTHSLWAGKQAGKQGRAGRSHCSSDPMLERSRSSAAALPVRSGWILPPPGHGWSRHTHSHTNTDTCWSPMRCDAMRSGSIFVQKPSQPPFPTWCAAPLSCPVLEPP